MISRSLAIAALVLATGCAAAPDESSPRRVCGLARTAAPRVIDPPTVRRGFDVVDDNERSREVVADTVRFIAERLAR